MAPSLETFDRARHTSGVKDEENVKRTNPGLRDVQQQGRETAKMSQIGVYEVTLSKNEKSGKVRQRT